MIQTTMVKVADIRRPVPSVVDEDKVDYLMNSFIQEGIQVPVDLLEYEGRLYGFNGCHRYTAAKRLGFEEIPAHIRSVDKRTLDMHLR